LGCTAQIIIIIIIIIIIEFICECRGRRQLAGLFALLGLFDPEDGGSTILRNAGKYFSNEPSAGSVGNNSVFFSVMTQSAA
jgi:hypothetical protein